MQIYEVILDELPTADSPLNGGICSGCGQPLGEEIVYIMDGEIVTAAYHKECEP
jgi:hypothetical protein